MKVGLVKKISNTLELQDILAAKVKFYRYHTHLPTDRAGAAPLDAHRLLAAL